MWLGPQVDHFTSGDLTLTHATSDQILSTIIDDLVAAQMTGDIDRLADLLTGDFTLVGPLGYVVERDNWLAQFRSGAMTYSALALEDRRIRQYDGAAIVVANQVQTATYGDRDASGAFRVTLIAVRQGDRWRLAGMHLSPMPPDGPPQRP
jgi:uncharacterized protein (TIGR02246 family)